MYLFLTFISDKETGSEYKQSNYENRSGKVRKQGVSVVTWPPPGLYNAVDSLGSALHSWS